MVSSQGHFPIGFCRGGDPAPRKGLRFRRVPCTGSFGRDFPSSPRTSRAPQAAPGGRGFCHRTKGSERPMERRSGRRGQSTALAGRPLSGRKKERNLFGRKQKWLEKQACVGVLCSSWQAPRAKLSPGGTALDAVHDARAGPGFPLPVPLSPSVRRAHATAGWARSGACVCGHNGSCCSQAWRCAGDVLQSEERGRERDGV